MSEVDGAYALEEAQLEGEVVYDLVLEGFVYEPPVIPPSLSGESARRLTIARQAVETISALKVLTAVDEQYVEVADYTDFHTSVVLGIALNAGNFGDFIEVLIFGVHDDALFDFPVNAVLFLGPDGVITTVPPVAPNMSTYIGYSLGAGQIFINIRDPLQLIL